MPSSKSTSSLSLGLAFAAGTAVGSILLHAVLVKRRRARESNSLEKARTYLWKIVEYSFTGALLYSGDKLRLYDTLTETGPITAEALAKHTNYSKRWLQEFLGQATAAGLCEYSPTSETFKIKHEFALLLQSPERSRESMAGMFQFLNALVSRAGATCTAIQTGIGVDYDYNNNNSDEKKNDIIQGIERKNQNWFAHHFVKDVIAQVIVPATNESLVKVLERGGANVADIGCGCGSSTIALAKRFPKSHFYAYELSPESLRVMEKKVTTLGLSNVNVCNVAERGMDQGPKFDFVYAHDVLHDMTNPRALIRQVRDSLKENGLWIIVDVDCHGSLHENLSKNTSSAVATSLGFSCLLCLSSSTSEEGGEGLGTLGFHEALARKWMTEAGFAHFRTMKIKSLPVNSCFIVG